MRGKPRFRVCCAAAAVAAALALAATGDLATVASEYAVKAAFLLNFAKLVEWPPARQPAAGRPFVVAVAGGADVEKALADGLAGKMVGDHPIVVRRIQSPDEVMGSHILYVVGEAQAGLLEAAHRSSALSVGESARFAERGGIVNFFTDDQKLRFEINPQAAEGAGLKISSRLLGLAVIVKN